MSDGFQRGVLVMPATGRLRLIRPGFVAVAIAVLSAQFVASGIAIAGDEPTASISKRPDHEGISGTLVIVGGGTVPADALTAFASALPADASVVIIGTASEDPAKAAESARKMLNDAEVGDLVVPEPAELSDEEKLAAQISAAGGVWICGGQQSRLAAAYVNTEVETALKKLLARGGVIGGTSAGAAIMSRVMIASGKDDPVMSAGLDLLPGAIVDQHFAQRSRIGRSRIAVGKNSECFGLGIDEATAVVVSGRILRVVGSGQATVLLAGSSLHPASDLSIPSGSVADLTQLRRAAAGRAADANPGLPVLGAPNVANGSLVIVGGGGMPQDIVNRFIELAGGKSARIVVLPTAGSRREAFRSGVPGFLAKAELESVVMLPQSRPEEIASDEFQQALKSATGVWFGGGRQWNFVDAYEGTNAIELFHDVLKRGGVIGGSSAGATIQGELLVRGHPLGNTVMMAEGYERGFGFLPGFAIDQHFAQRGRQPDLIPVVQRYPKMLAVGIDEATALVVQGTKVEVIGQHSAHFLTASKLDEAQLPDADSISVEDAAKVYVTVATGESIDLGTLVSGGQ